MTRRRRHRHQQSTANTHGRSTSALASAASSSSSRSSLSHRLRSIDSALTRAPPDVAALRELGLAHGFHADSVRTRAWPLMLELQAEVEEMDERAKKRAEKRREAGRRVFSEEDAQAAATLASTSTQALAAAPIPHHPLPAPYDYYTGIIRAHPYHTQVEKDIARSMAHLDVTKGYKQKQRTLARGALARVIHAIFSLHPDLHYVQGFHDIASVFLLVCATGGANQANFSLPANSRGEELAFLLTERLACLHIRDSLRPSLETVVQVLSLLFPLLLRADPDVYELLTGAQVPSFFTLSWLLTWFSHNLDRVSDASRVFDFFLAAHPLAPLYATAALILQMKEGLMNLKTKAIETARAEYEKENAEWMTTKRNGLPPRLRKLTLPWKFNQPLENEHGECILNLPSTLVELRFGRMFNQSLRSLHLPASLRFLSIPCSYYVISITDNLIQPPRSLPPRLQCLEVFNESAFHAQGWAQHPQWSNQCSYRRRRCYSLVLQSG